MRNNKIFAIILFVGIMSTAQAEVNVNINLGPPPFEMSVPSELIMIPQTGIYFVPSTTFDVFFYNNYWWTPRGAGWYRARQYNGPWEVIQRNHVPRHILNVPKNYQAVYKHNNSIKYDKWEKKHNNKRGDN